MIALLTACLFFAIPCARAELHQQKRARKLCSAILSTAAFTNRWCGSPVEAVEKQRIGKRQSPLFYRK